MLGGNCERGNNANKKKEIQKIEKILEIKKYDPKDNPKIIITPPFGEKITCDICCKDTILNEQTFGEMNECCGVKMCGECNIKLDG